MTRLITFTLLVICTAANGQEEPHFPSQSLFPSSTKKAGKHKPLTFYPGTYIDTEALYSDSAGMVVIIQNSLPKGGGYTDPAGGKFSYRIFWTRVINETSSPMVITVYFPAAPLELTTDFPTIGSSASSVHPSSYLRLFLPPDTMTLARETLYDYGATRLFSFLDAGLNKPTTVQRTINPGEDCVFYIGALFYQASGVARAELVVKNRKLFYRIQGIDPQLNALLIPCGQIVIDN